MSSEIPVGGEGEVADQILKEEGEREDPDQEGEWGSAPVLRVVHIQQPENSENCDGNKGGRKTNKQ